MEGQCTMTATAADIAASPEGSRMTIQDVMSKVFGLATSLDALAAVGARASAAPGALTPELEDALDEVLAAVGLGPLDQLAPGERAIVAGTARTLFGQAADLLAAPERPPGWGYTDPVVLEGQGRSSMIVPGLLAETGAFGDVTSLLDVGTGVGLLAVAATSVWPDVHVVGIDIWEPSLDLARANVAAAGLDDRVEIRRQDLAELDDVDRYDLTWLPSFFVPSAVLAPSVARILSATRRGGHIAIGRIDVAADPLDRATQRLKMVRDGGSVTSDEELIGLLTDAGWVDVRLLPRTRPVPVGFIVGSKP
jgi:SAM-dependent methyltransferase